jgi:hypothetical protein
MSAVSPLRLASLLIIVAAASACLTPYVSRKDALPEPRPAPTLIAGYTVQNPGSSRSILDLAQDSGLAEFGDASVAMVQTALAEKGFALAFDKLRTNEINQGGIGGDSATAALTGAYNHPQSSYWAPDLLHGPFVKPMDLIAKVKGSDGAEHFAFCAIYVRDLGILLKEPQVELRVDIFDGAGTKIISLRGVGVGETNFLVNNRSPSNLQVALERAIASFKPLQETPL